LHGFSEAGNGLVAQAVNYTSAMLVAVKTSGKKAVYMSILNLKTP